MDDKPKVRNESAKTQRAAKAFTRRTVLKSAATAAALAGAADYGHPAGYEDLHGAVEVVHLEGHVDGPGHRGYVGDHQVHHGPGSAHKPGDMIGIYRRGHFR